MTDTETSAEAVERLDAFCTEAERRRDIKGGMDHDLVFGLDPGQNLYASDLRALLAERDQLQAQLRKAERALRPFADCVFNDNGDMTVSDTHRLEHDDYARAYFAHNRLSAYRKARGETND